MRWLPFAGLALAVAVLSSGLLEYWPETSDDAYITLRYSQSLAEGRGPYFNPGERVEGYTNFLLMLVVALAIRLAGPGVALPTAKLVGALAAVGCVVVAFALARSTARASGLSRNVSDLAGGLAALLLAASASFSLNATRGLETTLFGFTLCLGAALALWGFRSGRWRGAGLAFALACLTRPEGVAVFAVFWVSCALAHARRAAGPARRQLLIDGVVTTSAVAAHLGFRLLSYDGEWLPNTFYAKVGGSRTITAADYVWQGISDPFLAGVGLAVGMIAVLAARGTWREVGPLAFTGLAAVCLPFVTGPDWMPASRLIVPYLPLLAAVVGLGWALAAERLAARAGRGFAGLVLVLALGLTWHTQAGARAEFARRGRRVALGLEQCTLPFVAWLDAVAHEGDTITLTDIGAIGFLAPQLRVLDVTGLTDRHIAKSGGGFLTKEYDVDYIYERAPRFITLALAAPRSTTPPAPDTRFVLWQTIEKRIFAHPDFARWYAQPRQAPPGVPWLERLAAEVGAARVFEFPSEEQYYLYAVFERRGSRLPNDDGGRQDVATDTGP